MSDLTLKQLEEKLSELEKHLKEHENSMDFNDEDVKTTYIKNGERIRVSHNQLQQYSLEERYEFAHDMIKNSQFNTMPDDFKGIMALDILGFRVEAFALWKKINILEAKELHECMTTPLKIQIERKRINSIGGKNRTNRHKATALSIAVATWNNTPGASSSSLAAKIYAYLSQKFTDAPEAGTIKTWLQKCEANPKVSPKTKNYDLVIKY